MNDDNYQRSVDVGISTNSSNELTGGSSPIADESSWPSNAGSAGRIDSGDLSDQTVISTTPPLTLQPAAIGLSPRELGQLLEGRQLDHVVLEHFVGGGGMGAVFRAWDTDLHRTVAVKVLSAYFGGDVESQRRFQTEARSAARLDHPNIARVHSAGEDDGIRYIVFEFIEGTNIRDLVQANGPLTVVEAVNYTLQIADALAHAWERDVVHRDIKPSNVIVMPDGTAKLVDMGLARLEPLDGLDNEETAAGVTLGTFDYIAPEQARDPRDADTRSDIYSLGCTLYYMLAGRPPFADSGVMQKLLLHQNEPPPDVRELRSDVPDALISILAKMLAKRPEERYQNPRELAAALVAAADVAGMTVPRAALPAFRQPARVATGWWRRQLPWLVPIVLLFVSVLILAIVWNRDASTTTFPDLDFPPSELPSADTAAAENLSN